MMVMYCVTLFTRTNILIRRFARCSVDVKIRFFTSHCICFFDVALWNRVKQSYIKKLKSAYVKCLKCFFLNFHKFASVTGMLLELGLLGLRIFRHNAEWSFSRRVSMCCNTSLQTVDKVCGAFAL